MLAGLDPHHPHRRGRVQMKIDRAELLDTFCGNRRKGFGVAVDPGFVRAGLADDPSLVDVEEPAERPAQCRMCIE